MRCLRQLGIAVLAAMAVAGCGDEEGNQIPSDQSRALREALGDVKGALREPDCNALRDTLVPAVETQVQNLPDDIDEDVRQTLQNAIEELRSLVADECAEATEPEPTPETTPAPAPTEPETTPAPPPTTPEEPEEEEEEEPPPDEVPPLDGGDGQGDGNGSGGTQGPGGGEKRGKGAKRKGKGG
jgi:hypothetical protein